MTEITREMTLRDARAAVEAKHGAWTAHNFSLGQETFTMGHEVVGDEVKLRRIVQIVSDFCSSPISELRILDLACLEGMYGIEFAKQGARVCGVEGRETSLEKACFAARTLGLQTIEFHLDDVRNVNVSTYGSFDVVLCLGLLYHLDAAHLFTFVEDMYVMTRRIAVIDTHVSLYSEQTFLHHDTEYAGKTVVEHAPDATQDEKRKALWASLDNPTSAYLTRPSLYRLLYNVGFTSVYECHVPQVPQQAKDRAVFVAVKGADVSLACCPHLDQAYGREPQEESPPPASVAIRPELHFLGRVLPGSLKRMARSLLFG